MRDVFSVDAVNLDLPNRVQTNWTYQTWSRLTGLTRPSPDWLDLANYQTDCTHQTDWCDWTLQTYRTDWTLQTYWTDWTHHTDWTDWTDWTHQTDWTDWTHQTEWTVWTRLLNSPGSLSPHDLFVLLQIIMVQSLFSNTPEENLMPCFAKSSGSEERYKYLYHFKFTITDIRYCSVKSICALANLKLSQFKELGLC